MAKKKSRSIRLMVPPAADDAGVFCILEGKTPTYYTFREIPCDIGGRAFAVHRLGVGNLYHVRIGERNECSCECLGYLRHHHCKHILGLLALASRQLLGQPLAPADDRPPRLPH